MIDLRQASEAVVTWQDACFPERTGDTPHGQLLAKAGKLCEEAGEVMGAVIKSRHIGERYTGHTLDKVDEELGDVIITWLAVCGHRGIDPEAILRERWDSVRRRGDVHPRDRHLCECGHLTHAHQTASCYPTPCRYCDCPKFALPGTAIER